MEVVNDFKTTYVLTGYDGLYIEILEYYEQFKGESAPVLMQEVYTFHQNNPANREFWYSTADRKMEDLLKDFDAHIDTRVSNCYGMYYAKRNIIHS